MGVAIIIVYEKLFRIPRPCNLIEPHPLQEQNLIVQGKTVVFNNSQL